eukprot:Hpha_TRINITY_DN15529_c3_g1::TRINITY_DN15529_c3_g1_i2::g.105979::m.105979
MAPSLKSAFSSSATEPAPRPPGEKSLFLLLPHFSQRESEENSRQLSGQLSERTISSPANWGNEGNVLPWSGSCSKEREPHSSLLSLGMMGSNATIATVRSSFAGMKDNDIENAVTGMLVGVETAALRTEGQVVCVLSALCVVGWNATHRCADHVPQSAHFAGLLKEGSHAGLSTGRIVSGNISATRRRHVTVAGSAVELSIALSEAAALRGFTFMA